MLTCPDCRSINPQHHNFCQGCGRSLTHHICHSCGGNVDFDAESCSHCQTTSGTYWRAIIELAAEIPRPGENTTVVQLDASEPEANPWNSDELILSPDSAVVSQFAHPTGSQPIEPNPWDDPIDPSLPPSPEQIDVKLAPKFGDSTPVVPALSQTLPAIGDLEPNPWAVVVKSEVNGSGDSSQNSPLVPTVYLDRQSRYRAIDPVVVQLLNPTDSCQLIAIDRQPFCNSPLETLMKQNPLASDPTAVVGAVTETETTATIEPDVAQLPASPSSSAQTSPNIPRIVRAYVALQASLRGTIPPIQDGWSEDGKTIVLVEDRSQWPLLLDRWNDPQISSTQIIYWLDHTLKLWVALEPWKMRQSLLELDNLRLDEDYTICFQRLCSESATPGENRKLKLADLAKLWRKLFDLSGSIPSPALALSIAAIETGELERIEEMRSRLQQIAYELEPKCLSSPHPTGGSEELTSNAYDAPTIAIPRKLIALDDAAATHTGKKRDHNEDCFGIVTQIQRTDNPKGRSVLARGLYILCDGMGGHAGGEIASAMTVDLLRDYFAIHWGDSLPDEETIREGIIATNEAVFKLNQQNLASGNARMGTTLVLVLVQDRNIVVAHVGDSRCYAITPSQGSIQLTIDHEVGQQQILRGVDPEIAYGRPDSYQLTQAIGPRDRNYIAPDIKFFELQEDTLLVLASDGLTDNQLMETHWLTNVAPLLSVHSNLQAGVDRLIDFANEYNGHDNITALVVRARLG
jgi:protein phosphatase